MLFTTPNLPIVDHPADDAHHGGARTLPIRFIVLHATASPGLDLAELSTRPGTKKSVHRVIDRDGTNYKLVPDYVVAWHAGLCRVGPIGLSGQPSMNEVSLGIEMVNRNDGRDPWTMAQVRMAAAQCVEWLGAYGLLKIGGHGEFDSRKPGDPRNFPRHDFEALVYHWMVHPELVLR